jgi:hypothetical protein
MMVSIDPNTNSGVATGSFYLSDLVTKFRVTANAFDSNGALGFNIMDF